MASCGSFLLSLDAPRPIGTKINIIGDSLYPVLGSGNAYGTDAPALWPINFLIQYGRTNPYMHDRPVGGHCCNICLLSEVRG